MDRLAKYAPIPLRLVIGGGLLYHGLPKLFPTAGHAEFVQLLQALSVPSPEPLALLVGTFDTVCAVLLLPGLWVRSVTPAVMLWTIVSAVRLSGMDGYPSGETTLLYLGGLTALFLAGSGPWSAGSGGKRLKAVESQTVIRAEPEGVAID